MKTIFFTTAHHEEVEQKLNVFEKLKLDNTNIANFSSIEKLVIIFQAFKPESKAMVATEHKIMRRKTKILELYLVLDYEKIMSGSDKENLTHIKEVFFSGCETFLKPMKSFDWDSFDKEILEALNNSL